MDLALAKVNELLKKNAELIAALESNKDDTAYITALFADINNDMNKIKVEMYQLNRMKKNAIIGVSITGGLCTAGGSLMTYGLLEDKPGMAITGGCMVAGSFGVWCLFHYVFKIW